MIPASLGSIQGPGAATSLQLQDTGAPPYCESLLPKRLWAQPAIRWGISSLLLSILITCQPASAVHLPAM